MGLWLRSNLSAYNRDNNLEECGLELFFSTDFEVLGKIEHHDLKAGGDDIKVTEDNKQEYIRLPTTSCLYIDLCIQ